MCSPGQSLIFEATAIAKKLLEKDKAKAAALLDSLLAAHFPTASPAKLISNMASNEYPNSRINI